LPSFRAGPGLKLRGIAAKDLAAGNLHFTGDHADADPLQRQPVQLRVRGEEAELLVDGGLAERQFTPMVVGDGDARTLQDRNEGGGIVIGQVGFVDDVVLAVRRRRRRSPRCR